MSNIIDMKQWVEDDEEVIDLGDIGLITFAVCSKKKLVANELKGDMVIYVKNGVKYGFCSYTKNELISAVNDQIIECKRQLEDGKRKGFIIDDEEETCILWLSNMQDSLRKIKEQPASRNYYTLTHLSLKSLRGETA